MNDFSKLSLNWNNYRTLADMALHLEEEPVVNEKEILDRDKENPTNCLHYTFVSSSGAFNSEMGKTVGTYTRDYPYVCKGMGYMVTPLFLVCPHSGKNLFPRVSLKNGKSKCHS